MPEQKQYLDITGLTELVKKSKEAFTNASIGSEDGAKSTILNAAIGGSMSYKPSTGKTSTVSVSSGADNAVSAKVMMQVKDSETQDGSTIYGSDTGFFYHKGTELTSDALDEILTKRSVQDMVSGGDLSNVVTQDEIADMATKTDVERDYAKKTEIEDMATNTEVEQNYAKKEQVTSDIASAKEETLGEVKTLIAGVYTPKGSSTFSALPQPSQDNLGFVYNVSEQFTTDSKFETEGETFPAGTNVVVVSVDDAYKYDVFTGELDLSNYVQDTDITIISNEDIDRLFV